ncbi:hypothetical protein M5689_002996 [Euphorbia peplus]|nr:hypothetical protein M5689_002996 [Euphorbia peplus]
MGKHPGEFISFFSSPSPSQSIMLKEILDPRLACPTRANITEDIIFVATIAFSCLFAAAPNSRPTMKYISQAFISHRAPSAKPPLLVSVLDLVQNT